MSLTMPVMDEYTFVGGPNDGQKITTNGARVLVIPVMQPLEVFRKVIPFHRGPEVPTETYTRYDRIYWWDGLIDDAYCEMDLSEEMAADLGGKAVRRLIRGEMRHRLDQFADGKGLGRIVWRIVKRDPLRGTITIRALVGPRAVPFGLTARSKRRSPSPFR